MKIPITKEYAKNMLLIHKAWKTNFNNMISDDYIKEFTDFLNSEKCPLVLKLSYTRMILNSTTQQHNEPTSKHEPGHNNDFLEDTQEAINLFATLPAKIDEMDEDDEFLDFGLAKDWSIQNIIMTDTEKEQAKTWFKNITDNYGKKNFSM